MMREPLITPEQAEAVGHDYAQRLARERRRLADANLEAVYRQAITELGLCSEARAGSGAPTVRRGRVRDRRLSPSGESDYTAESYERRWRDPDEDRVRVVAELLLELEYIRHSPPTPQRLAEVGTVKWKKDIAAADGSLRDVARRFNCSHEYVRKLRERSV
jgi:hypothetical protein